MRANSEGRLLLNIPTKLQIALETGVCLKTIERNLVYLAQTRVLKKIERGLYAINPKVVAINARKYRTSHLVNQTRSSKQTG